ncbi:Uncharacterised protein [Candidatus Gugararchaeum adminiculabundum]|nr:Uncharacterised protein [Candidatus Gugararchaeum adminiculabundum]
MKDLSGFSFGATSAVTSSLALMVGLIQLDVSRTGLIGALLVIGLADNIADSLGMHIYSESRSRNPSKLSTITNYLTRLGITLLLIAFVLFLPISLAIIASVIVGMLVIAVLSYLIAKEHSLTVPRSSFSIMRNVTEHLAVAALVLVMSNLVGSAIHLFFHS